MDSQKEIWRDVKRYEGKYQVSNFGRVKSLATTGQENGGRKMSEEKLYAIKNDEGDWADTRYIFGYGAWVTPDKNIREEEAKHNGGHVVALIEEPEKVVVPVWFDEFVQKYEDNLSNEEMARLRIIGKICQSGWGTTFNSQLNRDIPDEFNPFDLDDYQLCYVNEHKDELVHALSLNSWTVAKEKKYNVKVPHTEDVWYYKASKAYLQTICPADDKKLRGKFTEAEIEHYGLQDCEKMEAKD